MIGSVLFIFNPILFFAELYINSNHLGTLPNEMIQFEVLETLDISHNEFTSLPSVVYKMGSLKTLNTEKNLITGVYNYNFFSMFLYGYLFLSLKSK